LSTDFDSIASIRFLLLQKWLVKLSQLAFLSWRRRFRLRILFNVLIVDLLAICFAADVARVLSLLFHDLISLRFSLGADSSPLVSPQSLPSDQERYKYDSLDTQGDRLGGPVATNDRVYNRRSIVAYEHQQRVRSTRRPVRYRRADAYTHVRDIDSFAFGDSWTSNGYSPAKDLQNVDVANVSQMSFQLEHLSTG